VPTGVHEYASRIEHHKLIGRRGVTEQIGVRAVVDRERDPARIETRPNLLAGKTVDRSDDRSGEGCSTALRDLPGGNCRLADAEGNSKSR